MAEDAPTDLMDAWQVTPVQRMGDLRPSCSGRSYPAVESGDVSYAHEVKFLRTVHGSSRRVGPILELAIGSATAPRPLLESKGWILRDPFEAAPDPWAYQRYIQQSKAEFTVAKHGYVVSRSGWFSERSAAYLASGRPVVTQETGFTDWLDVGIGVIPFTTGEAIAAIEDVNSRYEVHCRAARALPSIFRFRQSTREADRGSVDQ